MTQHKINQIIDALNDLQEGSRFISAYAQFHLRRRGTG